MGGDEDSYKGQGGSPLWREHLSRHLKMPEREAEEPRKGKNKIIKFTLFFFMSTFPWFQWQRWFLFITWLCPFLTTLWGSVMSVPILQTSKLRLREVNAPRQRQEVQLIQIPEPGPESCEIFLYIINEEREAQRINCPPHSCSFLCHPVQKAHLVIQVYISFNSN